MFSQIDMSVLYYKILVVCQYTLISLKCRAFVFHLRFCIDKHKLRVPENRVLRRIFGPKRDEVTGEWRKLLNK
jgi:hypothetical protein